MSGDNPHAPMEWHPEGDEKLIAEVERLKAMLHQKMRQYDEDMQTMQRALNREIEARRALEGK
jgi:hypothetical protein